MRLLKFMTLIFTALMIFCSCSPINNSLSSNYNKGNIKNGAQGPKNTSIGNAMAEEYPVSVPEIKQEVSVMVEAENSELMGNLFISEERGLFG